jgi:hypothetical protein
MPLEATEIERVHVSQIEVFEVPFDIARERKAQLAVDEGHQPWRINAESVACAEIAGLLLQRNVKPELEWSCLNNVKTEGSATKARVTVQRDKVQYRVDLERLIRTDGIWTAKKIEVVNSPN